MIIAREKKANNIAEYLIYMFQVEDMIRASNFNLETITKNIISQFKVDEIERGEIRDWYSGLIEMMTEEQIKTKGHLQFIKNTLADVNNFNIQILQKAEDNKYLQLYQKAKPNIDDLKNKVGSNIENEIEVCINGLYSLFLLRLQKTEISAETLASFKTFSEFLAYLSLQYKKYESGEIEL